MNEKKPLLSILGIFKPVVFYSSFQKTTKVCKF